MDKIPVFCEQKSNKVYKILATSKKVIPQGNCVSALKRPNLLS